jgi:hypothetical protein
VYSTTTSSASTFTPPVLTAANIQWQSNQVNQVTSLSLTFTSAYDVSAGSSIELVFPYLYVLSSDVRHYFSGGSGTLSVSCTTGSALTGSPSCIYTYATAALSVTSGFPTKVNAGISIGVNINNVNTPYTCSPVVKLLVTIRVASH